MKKTLKFITALLSPIPLDSEFFSWRKSAILGICLILLNFTYSLAVFIFFGNDTIAATKATYFRVFWIIFVSPFIETIIIAIIFLILRNIVNIRHFSIACGIITGGILHYPWGWSTPYQIASFMAFSYMFYAWQKAIGWRSAILMVSISHLIANIPPAAEKLLDILLKQDALR